MCTFVVRFHGKLVEQMANINVNGIPDFVSFLPGFFVQLTHKEAFIGL